MSIKLLIDTIVFMTTEFEINTIVSNTVYKIVNRYLIVYNYRIFNKLSVKLLIDSIISYVQNLK